MRKQPTVYDVANRAGVSIATVSRVLQGPQTVRESTRERVLTAVRELGYVPSASARGLAGRRTRVLGLLLPGESEREPEPPMVSTATGDVAFVDDREGMRAGHAHQLYFDEILRGAEDAAWRAGYALMITAGRGMSRDVVLDDISGRVDGLAVLASTLDDALIRRAARRLPLVVLAGDTPDEVDRVSVDNRGGMRALAAHVLAVKPPGPLLYLDGPDTSPDAAARAEGFRDAVPADLPEVHHAGAEFTEPGGRAAVAEFLDRGVPGAVVAANDQSALGALAALAEAGVRVPEDCVVTGFDGIDAGRYSTPRLTTVRQPMAQLGETAMEAIITRLEDRDLPPRAIELPVDVLLRGSCPPG
ncbi:LacI family DNA-binding transcriptional regulator [Ruania halotolerans]|uniref:LacI family DNA-binding transcriptional regulator n=1 Tax=Ruania halotolerans TaxID=2897773 RepID=UPI001E4C1E48|nr:LacI family DNA-binding transcriptional regulator [Ruania halotolerans]UFU06836.1 LacI family transcriptional regulator [Ruania halotolerans]